MWLNIPAVLLLISVSNMNGITVFAHYESLQCDPLASGQIDSPNKILAQYVKTSFKSAHGFSGFFLATLYSGALSSVSSSLSGCAAITWEDILKNKFSHFSEFRAAVTNKILVLMYGLLAAGIAFLPRIMSGPISEIALVLLSAIAGPLTGMFLLGGLVPFADWKGAFSGGLVGFAINAWISGGSIGMEGQHPPLPPISVAGCPEPVNITDAHYPEITGLNKFYTISYLWYVPIGALTTLLVGVLVSLIPPRGSQDVPDRLLIHPRYVCTSPFREDAIDIIDDDVKQTNTKTSVSELAIDSSLGKTSDSNERLPRWRSVTDSVYSADSYGPDKTPYIHSETCL